MRSNALATGRTTLQAIEGTVPASWSGQYSSWQGPVLWQAMPITGFLAAYASSTIGFVAGQAAFTVVVITLINLISPVGWRLGLARIEDVAVAGIPWWRASPQVPSLTCVRPVPELGKCASRYNWLIPGLERSILNRRRP